MAPTYAMSIRKSIRPSSTNKRADMATNTTILISVVAALLLGLAGILAAVVYKTRTDGARIGDQAGDNARHLEHQQAVADECAVQAHAAQVEVDVKSARGSRPTPASE
jgi:hypothetical protein